MKSIESFVRDDLTDILQSYCTQQKIELGPALKKNFFGTYYTDPLTFHFTHEERKLIFDIGVNEITFRLEKLDLRTDSKKANIWYFENETCNSASPSKEHRVEENTQTHIILRKLLTNADRNCQRPPAGYRFDRDVKDWAAYFRMLAGPLGYATIQENLPHALPSLSTINHFIQNTKLITESVLRSHELEIYLRHRNLPLIVTISEDATRIQGRVQYDSGTNQVVGFVQPINNTNGLPIPFVFKARNTEEIVTHFTSNASTASFVNTIMVQPIAKVPPFCLLLFGTDCKFSSENVATRWMHVVSELKKSNIDVLTVSSDSDPKYNSAMRKNSMLGSPSKIFEAEWFSCGDRITPPFYVQDTIHIATKLRNYFLKTLKDQKMVPFGNKYYARVDHLKTLINLTAKDKHQLTQSVLDPNDRQNFESVLKICDPKVSKLLKEYVCDSDATVKVLELIRNIIESFMDSDLKPLERIFKIWYSLFIIRIWRKYVISKKSLTLKNNFLTNYCYICIELNAHSLVLIFLYLRSINRPDLLMPIVYSSQPCESFYRQIRSFTSTYSTVANCSVKEILERISKIQLQNDISSNENLIFKFPKKLNSKNTGSPHNVEQPLPSENEIFETIERAKKMAIGDSIKIGLLDSKETDISLKCGVFPYAPTVVSPQDGTHMQSNKIESALALSRLRSVSLKNYSDAFKNKEVSECSIYTEVFGGSKRIIIKKTSLCWLLRKNEGKLSSDRLKRVQASARYHSNYGKKNRKTNKKLKTKCLLYRNLN